MAATSGTATTTPTTITVPMARRRRRRSASSSSICAATSALRLSSASHLHTLRHLLTEHIADLDEVIARISQHKAMVLRLYGQTAAHYLVAVDYKHELWSNCAETARAQRDKAESLHTALATFPTYRYRRYEWYQAFHEGVTKWLRNIQRRRARLPHQVSELQRQSETVLERFRLPHSTCAASRPIPRFF